MRGSRTVGLGLLPAVAFAALAASPPAARKPNILLVTLDTTRSDHLGCYGARAARTPVVDSLAAKGTRYARAVSASPLTLPAHSTLMTGLDPPEHGMRDNGVGALHASIPTLAQVLSAQGYATAAFVASRVLDRRFGLARGFDQYDDRMAAEKIGEYGYPERDAAAVTSAATAWLGRSLGPSPNRPYFLWVHYYDAHAPYEPPAPWKGTTAESNYSGEIGYVDHELGRLLAALPGGESSRLVAVVADHGEALGEHGEKGHGLFIYRASLEVPLVLQGFGVPKGRVVQKAVGARALAATLLRLAGLRTASRDFGQPLPGLPISDERAAPEEVYSETLMPATAFGWSALKAITQEPWRLILAPRPELYDFVGDPKESRNRLADQPEIVARLKGVLETRERSMRPRQTASAAPDPDVAASLRSLGYVSGASAPPERAAIGGIDPKDGVGMLAELEDAKQATADGKPELALRKLEDLVRRSPRNVPFLGHLATAQFAAGRRDQAIETYRRALLLNPALDFLHVNLAQMLAEAGRVADAEREYEAALRLNPGFAKAWMGLAELAMKEDRDGSKERRILARAVDAGTESSAVFTRLAQLDEAAGNLQAADQNLRRATELAPDWGVAWLVWGDLAETQARTGDALERYRRAYEAEPTNATALLRAGRLLVRERRVDEGRSLLERAAAIAPGSAEAQEARRWLDGLATGR